MGVRNFISTKYIGCRRDPISNLKSGGGASSYPGAKSLYLLDYSTATFTRTSEAAYVDPRQNWEFVDPTYGTEVTAHASELNSYDDWSVVGTPTSSSAVAAPSGEASVEWTDIDTVGNTATYKDFSSTAWGSRIGLSLYLRKDDDTSRMVGIALHDQTPTPTYFLLTVNTSTGESASALNPGTEYSPSSSVEDFGDWWKVSLSRIVRDTIRIALYPAVGTSLGTRLATATGSATFGDLSLTEELHGAFKLANQPRIFSDGAILIEGSRTNQLRISPDLSSSTYTVNASSLTQSIGPAGDVGYYLWTPQGASSYVSDGNAIPSFTPATGTVAASWYAKKFADDNKPYAFWYNDDVGNAFVDMEATSSDWSRAALTIEDFRVRFGIFDSGSAETNTIPLHIYGPQIEEATFPSSFIRCFSVDTTRASDSCIIPAANVPQEMKTGAFEFDFWPEFGVADSASNTLFRLDGSNRIVVAGSAITLIAEGSSFSCPTGMSYGLGDKITIRVDWSGTMDVFINDVLHGTSPAITADWSAQSNNLSIGSISGGGSELFGVISRPRRIKDA